MRLRSVATHRDLARESAKARRVLDDGRAEFDRRAAALGVGRERERDGAHAVVFGEVVIVHDDEVEVREREVRL